MISFSRRGLGLALAGCALGAGAARADATGAVRFPLRMAVARLAPGGLARIPPAEMAAWTAMQARLGALAEQVEPLQASPLLGATAPDTGDSAAALLTIRTMAAQAGFNLVTLYAVHDGRRSYTAYRNWLDGAFASVRSALGPRDRPTAEAYLLDVGGGAPLAAATADAAPRQRLNPLDYGRDPAREAIEALTREMERRLQGLARNSFAAQRSIAD